MPHVEFVLEDEFEELTVTEAAGGGFCRRTSRVLADRRGAVGGVWFGVEGSWISVDWGCFGWVDAASMR